MPLPCFFPSISSVKTNLSPLEYLRVLVAVNHPQFLISAYDLFNCPPDQRPLMETLVEEAVTRKKAVFLDSGNYESYWKKDKDWNVESFRSVLKRARHQLAFCFNHQNPPDSPERIIDTVEEAVLRDQNHSLGVTVVPIVHAPTAMLPEVALGVAERLHPILVAIPERRLGDGIIDRAAVLLKIRKALNQTGRYYALHLLGTGSPLSILIYTLCGADSFDGLEWCQTTVDHRTALLYHFQQREFFGKQTVFCTMSEIPYTQATLAHNLLFYRLWMEQIHTELSSGNISGFLQQYLPDAFLQTLSERLPEVL